MPADLTIRQGDTSPALSWQVVDAAGVDVNLVGASVTWVMRQLTSTVASVNQSAVIVDGPSGRVQYQWQPSDTATAGLFTGEWHVRLGNGQTFTSPPTGYLEVSVEENLVTPGGATIVSLGEVKDYLRLPSSDRSSDAKLIRFVRAATPVVEGIVGAVTARTWDEWYDGGQSSIRLRHRPVLAVTACTMYLGAAGYPMTVVADPSAGSIYSVMLDGDGRLTRRTSGGGQDSFPAGADSVHVVYQVGRAPVPENIREGTLELLRVNYQRTQEAGRPQIGGGGGGADDEVGPTVPMGFMVPGRVREFLAPHKRHPSVA